MPYRRCQSNLSADTTGVTLASCRRKSMLIRSRRVEAQPHCHWRGLRCRELQPVGDQPGLHCSVCLSPKTALSTRLQFDRVCCCCVNLCTPSSAEAAGLSAAISMLDPLSVAGLTLAICDELLKLGDRTAELVRDIRSFDEVCCAIVLVIFKL
jgi:hypothetical protein